MLSPKSASRALSPQRTANGGGERPFSPRTAVSQQQSLKSRNTQKTNRTAYPPLPESVLEENMSKAHTQRAPSPVDRQTNKSPSLAPSDSVTEALSKRTARAAAAAQEAFQKPSKSVKSSSQVNGGEQYATSQRGMLIVLATRSSELKSITRPLRQPCRSLSGSHVASLSGRTHVSALASRTHVEPS